LERGISQPLSFVFRYRNSNTEVSHDTGNAAKNAEMIKSIANPHWGIQQQLLCSDSESARSETPLEVFTFAKRLQNGYNSYCLREANTYQEVITMCNIDCSFIWQILSQLCGVSC